MEGRKPTGPSRSRLSSQRWKSSPIQHGQPSSETVRNPWPVTKPTGRKDTILEAAQALVRARNAELVNQCGNAITLLPASGPVPGFQGGSHERPLYSLRSPSLEPFKVHLWQIPAVSVWNETAQAWDITSPRVMVRRGVKSEPFTRLLQTLGVAKCETKMTDLCNHFHCWRSLNTRDEWLNEYPKHLRGMVYQRWWSFNGFRFLELPPELRELILQFSMEPIIVPFANFSLNPYYYFDQPDLSLSRVSKQLNREAIAALLAHTTFYFDTLHQLSRFFEHTIGRSRVLKRPLRGLRSLDIDLRPCDLLLIFQGESSDLEFPGSLRAGAAFDGDTPLCHRLRINIQSIYRGVNARQSLFCCQKVQNLAFWVGSRARLRNIPVVELTGCIDETQKRELLAEHALGRKGVMPEEKDLAKWQRATWAQW